MVVYSHFFSKKYCLVIQLCGKDNIIKEIYEKILDKPYIGEFEPVILREWGRLIEVRYFDYMIERNLEEEIRYVAIFIGRFREVDEEIKEKNKELFNRKVRGWEIYNQ